MHRKSLYKTIMIFGLGLLMAAMVVSPCQAASKITIEAISAWPKTTFMVQNFTRFIDNTNAAAAKKYPGEFEIKYKGGPEIISFKEQVEAVRTGLSCRPRCCRGWLRWKGSRTITLRSRFQHRLGATGCRRCRGP